MSDYGKETVVFFEIDQPFCTRTYGTAPCTAVLGVTGARKCYNTRATCQDPANYAPEILTLRFARQQDGLLRHADKYGPVIPIMISLETTPGSINLASMNRSMSALGQRETVSVMLEDGRHSDHLVDKYRLERKSGAAASPAFDPYTQGTFWGKWSPRNPYNANYTCRVREGFLGQFLHEMRARTYMLAKLEGPGDGQVRIVAKDLFSVIEARKAVAPLASTGELLADISDVAGSLTLSPAGIGDEEYPASGWGAIGDEVVAFTRAGDAVTLARGAFNTDPDEHKAEDLFQLVLTYSAQLVQDIIYDLFVDYSAIPTASIPKAEWDALAAELTQLYTTRITKPTPVIDLIGELCEQGGATVWPDVASGEIRFAPLRPVASVVTVDDTSWIVDGSLTPPKRQDAKRLTQVWVYYGQIRPNEDLSDRRNFHSRIKVGDIEAEADEQYGVPSIDEIFSRWIPQFGRQSAQEVGERKLAMFRDAPLEAAFSIHSSRDGALDLARPFTLRTAEVQDDAGAVLDVLMVPVQLERGENEIGCTAEQINFSGGGSSPLGGNDRTIFIENDSFNLNLRTVHDSLFAAPTGVETVTFIVVSGFTVGSTSTGVVAMAAGNWP